MAEAAPRRYNAAEVAYAGAIREAEDRAKVREAELEAERPWRRLHAFGVPSRVCKLLREGKQEQNAGMREVQDVPKGNRCIAVLAGTPGSGKTVAACWWLSLPATKLDCEMLGAHTTARRFIRTPDLMAMAVWSEQYQEVLWSRRLVLDDLGMEPPRDSKWIAKFDSFLDHRIGNSLPTAITTNIASKDLRKRYGDRVGSRLIEAAHLITMLSDYRTKARQEDQ